MFDDLAEIKAQLRAGEDSFAEFKELRLGKRSVTSPNTEAFAGELVAFANAEGGVVFLGVADDGTVRGIPEPAYGTVERWVIDVATSNCDPPIRPILRKVYLADPAGNDALVALVEVHRSHYVHSTMTGRWLVRVGSTKRKLTGQELPRLFQQRGRAFVFDEQPVMTATADDLDRPALERFFSGSLTIPWAELLLKTRVLVRDEDGAIRPTVAGLLAFSQAPESHLFSATIETGVYRRERLDSGDLVHSSTLTGPVPKQIDEALTFVDRFMLRPATKDVGRLDFPQYDLAPVYEAIVNALVHRDYSLSGAKIRLFLYSDRLELYSPGALPNTLTLDDMPFRVFTRNQLLVNFLSRMRSETRGRVYLESRGEGVRRILDHSERHSGRRPEYRLIGEELLLTIWAQPSPHEGAGEG